MADSINEARLLLIEETLRKITDYQHIIESDEMKRSADFEALLFIALEMAQKLGIKEQDFAQNFRQKSALLLQISLAKAESFDPALAARLDTRPEGILDLPENMPKLFPPES